MARGFFIDETKCTGCKACVVTCKDKRNLDAGFNLRFVNSQVWGSFPHVRMSYHSRSCNNCKNPACVENCPSGAMSRDNELGVVKVDLDVCIGCGKCAKACPFGAPTIDSDKKKSMKCDFCFDLTKDGQNPACMDVCNSRALEFGDLDELQKAHPDAKEVEGDTRSNTLVLFK